MAGTLFLHQFPAGAHASLTVVDPPVRIADLDGREPFTEPYAPTRRSGPCLLYLQPSCAPACAADQLCTAPDSCAPLQQLRNVDVGSVQITGSSIAPLIRLWFIAADQGYGADPPPGFDDLFAGGETLSASGGSGPYALRATWQAPQPVQVLEPDLTKPLHLPEGAFVIRWRPAGAAQMVLKLLASRQDLGWGDVRCLVPDSGAFTVPAEVMAALPPPPRTVHLEVERDEETLAPLGLGQDVAMQVHAAFTAWQNGADP